MIKLFSDEELKEASGATKLSLQCERCAKIYYVKHRYIRSAIKLNTGYYKYCSKKCRDEAQITQIISPCGFCSKQVSRVLKEYKKSKSGKVFCNNSCAASYNNSHKTTGIRRSKLECWIEEQLRALHPTLDILCNDKTLITAELDFSIPSLKLAVEINGIFHYRPIYGQKKFLETQKMDFYKKNTCAANNIELIIIDVSLQKRFTPDSSKAFLDIITSIISKKLIV